MRVGVMVTNYNQADWPRLLAGDYQALPEPSDLAIHTETMALGELVEPLGYDDIWCAEHYGSAYSMQGNPLQWLAFWAGRTRRIGVGTAVIVLPWANPVKLVHEIAILDLLLEGRPMHLGIGRGISKHEYEAFGVPSGESRERFTEMVEILRKSEELRFSHDGQHYQVPEMTVRPMARHRGSLFEKMKGAFNTPQSMVLAAELGLAGRFEWRGQVDRAGKLALLTEVDLFAMPTTHPEAKGIPVLEAFTAGLPVVASDHGAFPEYVGRDPATCLGLLCTPGDPAAFHAALLMLADDPGLAERMGRDAFATARERFTPDAMAAGHEQVYAELLAARKR